MRHILHVDMDAFYASVEQRDDPSLRGKPLVVGGPSRRGVVTAASYEARPFGVHSAMPMAEALRKCPHVIAVPPRMARYAEVSAQVFSIFRRFTPLVEGLSLDEAFLDVTASRSLFGDGEAIARQIKDCVKAELGLTASAGVAPCKFVAKVASDLEKPDGLVVVGEGEVREFLAPLPIERMWGVGPKSAPRLHAMGFHTLGDLAAAKRSKLEPLLGSWGAHVRALARGEDDRAVDPERAAKSVGAEQTYETDLYTREALEKTLLEHAARVAQRLYREELSGRTITVKLKYADFTLRSRCRTLSDPVADTGSIYDVAREILTRFPRDRRGVRLTGVSVSDLWDGPAPPTLFPDVAVAKRKKVEAVIAQVRDRFGEGDLLTHADLSHPRERGSVRPARRDPRRE